jgi:hypothetical protein
MLLHQKPFDLEVNEVSGRGIFENLHLLRKAMKVQRLGTCYLGLGCTFFLSMKLMTRMAICMKAYVSKSDFLSYGRTHNSLTVSPITLAVYELEPG